ncbi:hypothetical protein GF327_07510, partial [Candidatus Woesearchaeota archaeon]|nr:hypothetical protein [Candidatus Woesearchaeota archaeon]
MGFELDKKNTIRKLQNLDKSKKGCVDEKIKDLVDFLNDSDDFYTTSSCSGRIMILTDPAEKKKHEVKWLFSSHHPVKYQDIDRKLKNLPDDVVYFRMEAPILHVCARNMEKADFLLDCANQAGFRRAGIITISRRIIIEIFSTERIDVPVSENK